MIQPVHNRTSSSHPTMDDPVPGTEARRELVIARLRSARVIPVLRSASAAASMEAADRCLRAGLTAVELTTTTPNWSSALAVVRAEHSDQLIGVGTVLTADDARLALDGGADFLVSPCPAPAVREACGSGELLIEGGLTVGEVLGAARHGLAKLFPAHVGGVQYLRSILAVAPAAKIVPTGGIQLSCAGEWLAAGAWAVGVGNDLLGREDLAAAIAAALDTQE